MDRNEMNDHITRLVRNLSELVWALDSMPDGSETPAVLADLCDRTADKLEQFQIDRL